MASSALRSCDHTNTHDLRKGPFEFRWSTNQTVSYVRSNEHPQIHVHTPVYPCLNVTASCFDLGLLLEMFPAGFDSLHEADTQTTDDT